jgi:ubiquinone biosynthesis protein UbiJ
MSSDSDRDNDKRGKKKEKKRYYKKKGGDAHVCREWDSDESSTDSSSDEDAANITVNKGLLFPNVGHQCFMAKDGKKKKVQTRTTLKYTTSSDEGSSSDDEDDLLTLFANLNMQQKEKLNELIGAIHEKDELLDSQEEFIIKENKRHVKVKNAYAQEVEKNENSTKELSICHDSITNLRNENASLIAKIDKLNESISSLRTENASLISKAKDLNVCNDSISCLRNENAILNAKIEELKSCKPSTSIVDHVISCTRCRDVNIDAINDHLALIKQQNDYIAQLTVKNNEHEIENEKFKFARSMLYNGRRPCIKDGIGFQQRNNVKLNAPKRLSNFVKGKTPIVQDNKGYILYPANYTEHKIRRIHAKKSHSISHHAFIYKNEASNSRHSTHVKMPKKKTHIASNEPNISFKTFDAPYVLTNKSGKVVAKYVAGKHKGSKTCVWVPKVLISNIKGLKTVWVPKNKAYIVLQVYASRGSSWIIDSRCTNHMTGEKMMFSSYEKNEDRQKAITFGDGNQGLVKGLGKISISPDHSISNVFLVDYLDYNLLSVSQLCKMGYNCLFTDIGVTVFRRSDDSVAFKGVLEGHLYLVDFNKAELDTCLIAKTNMGWL